MHLQWYNQLYSPKVLNTLIYNDNSNDIYSHIAWTYAESIFSIVSVFLYTQSLKITLNLSIAYQETCPFSIQKDLLFLVAYKTWYIDS